MADTDTAQYFNAVLFDDGGDKIPIDAKTYPYVRNVCGKTFHVQSSEGARLIRPAEENPEARLGRVHKGITWKPEQIPTQSGSSYTITRFDFGIDIAVYEPIWADWETARAFGFTLMQDNDCLEFRYDGMITQDYSYGIYAGYQSPYITVERQRELLPDNPTDLEYHAFPHIFCSQDSAPLVISVARFRPLEKAIWLADLWVRPKECLFLPPKPVHLPDSAFPDYVNITNNTYYDMHGNRNSAQASRYVDSKLFLATNTTLGDDAVFSADATKPRYHRETHPTLHSRPAGA